MQLRWPATFAASSLLALLVTVLPPAEAAEPPVSITPRGGRVALTFDDGPHPRWTPVILDILDGYGVKATFFVQGWKVDAHPGLAREIVARGHSLQSHTYGHENLPRLGDGWVTWSLLEANRAIAEASGAAPTCLRPPYGATSPRVDRLSRAAGLEPVGWDVNTRDYAHGSAAAAIAAATAAEPGDVILMHDTLGPIWEAALPVVIEHFQERGIGFDTLCIDRPTAPPWWPRRSPRPA